MCEDKEVSPANDVSKSLKMTLGVLSCMSELGSPCGVSDLKRGTELIIANLYSHGNH